MEVEEDVTVTAQYSEDAGGEPEPEPELAPDPKPSSTPTPTPEPEPAPVADDDGQNPDEDDEKGDERDGGKNDENSDDKPKQPDKKPDNGAEIGTPIAPESGDGGSPKDSAADGTPKPDKKLEAGKTNDGSGGSGAVRGGEDIPNDGKDKDDGLKDEENDKEEDDTAEQDDDADNEDGENNGADEEKSPPSIFDNGWFLLLIGSILFGLTNLLFFLLLWLSRWKLRGEILDKDGNPAEGISMKLFEDGEAVQETVTDDKGGYIFRGISRDEQELRVYGKDGQRILTMKVIPKEKDLDDVFRITRKKVTEVEVERIRRTLFADITV